MTDQNPVDPDATPPYGVVGGTEPDESFRTGRFWFVVIGAAVALILLTLIISRS